MFLAAHTLIHKITDNIKQPGVHVDLSIHDHDLVVTAHFRNYRRNCHMQHCERFTEDEIKGLTSVEQDYRIQDIIDKINNLLTV